MSDSPVFMGMGNPLLDICADVPMELLEKYDVKLNNAILCEEKHQPVYKDLIDNHKVEYRAGGATQNSVRVVQWMTQKEGTTSYIGAVGKDEYAASLKKSATEDGVAVYYHEDEKEPTGTCAALIHKHERSLIANLAAANKYSIDHLKSDEIKKVYESAKYYYIAGFFLTVSPPSIMHIAEHALAEKKVLAMNLSAPFLCQFFKDPMMAAMPYVDYLFGNESEAKAFGETHKLEDTSTEAVAVHCSKLEKKGETPRVVVFTQGAEETIVVKDGKVTKFAVPKIPEKEMVDVNGAGDAFVGGFMAYLIQGAELQTCIDAGHYAAGYIIRRSGTIFDGKPEFSPSK